MGNDHKANKGTKMTQQEFESLVRSLIKLPKETEWVEFKRNNFVPEEIGENLSALANSAALLRRPAGHIVWGIEDGTHAIVGTTFKPKLEKVKGQELENWLVTQLQPRIDVRIHEGNVDGKRIIVFEVQPASYMPVRFKDAEFIRIGSYTKKLRDHPEKERALWALFSKTPFEQGIALAGVSSDDVLSLIAYPKYFELVGLPLPDNRAAILNRLKTENIICGNGDDRYDISNLGAVLLAQNLKGFERLGRKALRIIVYRGDNRVETIKEWIGEKGYAVSFEGAIRYINDQLPQNEQIEQALRRQVRMYPEIAIRELVANALIHQDFSLTGTGPMVEIFSDRMEITNPGIPLIDTLRFIDEPPRSRNEQLAAMMRRMNICEERGSGIDKVVFAIEAYQLPAPDFRITPNHTVAVLFGPRKFSAMHKVDRIRACYQHACLWFVSGKHMTNTSLRKRLGISDKNYPVASRVIADTIKAGLIKSHVQSRGSKKNAKYVPFWA